MPSIAADCYILMKSAIAWQSCGVEDTHCVNVMAGWASLD